MTTLLLILDGWGEAENSSQNAIALANTPTWDYLYKNSPHSKLIASGPAVGLPENQAGNSEVGHLHIGSGRVVEQDLVRINNVLKNNQLPQTKITEIINTTKKNQKKLHLIGLLSPGGVHSHEQHLFSIIDYAEKQKCPTVLHLILDGRDTNPKSAKSSINQLEQKLIKTKYITIATISGRYYAMDRDQRWDRTQLYYNQLIKPNSEQLTLLEMIEKNYKNNITDEFIKPTAYKDAIALTEQDSVLCFNFRADRSHQIMQALGNEDFNYFTTKIKPIKKLYSMTTYPFAPKHTQAIFPLKTPKNTLGSILEQSGLKQLRIAETEKYAHVTFFLDGGKQENFTNMTKTVIPSPKVATYDLKPEMSCYQIADEIITGLNTNKFDVIIANFANADMVGHTGKMQPTIQAIEHIDNCLASIKQAIDEKKGQMLITADHGNADCMGSIEKPITAHSNNPVPLLYYGEKKINLANGSLANITPTLLNLLHIKQPDTMTEESLASKKT